MIKASPPLTAAALAQASSQTLRLRESLTTAGGPAARPPRQP